MDMNDAFLDRIVSRFLPLGESDYEIVAKGTVCATTDDKNEFTWDISPSSNKFEAVLYVFTQSTQFFHSDVFHFRIGMGIKECSFSQQPAAMMEMESTAIELLSDSPPPTAEQLKNMLSKVSKDFFEKLDHLATMLDDWEPVDKDSFSDEEAESNEE